MYYTEKKTRIMSFKKTILYETESTSDGCIKKV